MTIKDYIAKQKKEEPGLFAKLRSDKTLIQNLLMMNMVWTCGSFIFFLLGFLVKYMPGDIYYNSLIAGLSSFAMLLEGKIQKTLGSSQAGMMASFIITLGSIVALSFFDRHTDQIVLFAIVLLIAKSGASLAFGFAYAIHIDLFPAHFLISSYGICNFFSRRDHRCAADSGSGESLHP